MVDKTDTSTPVAPDPNAAAPTAPGVDPNAAAPTQAVPEDSDIDGMTLAQLREFLPEEAASLTTEAEAAMNAQQSVPDGQVPAETPTAQPQPQTPAATPSTEAVPEAASAAPEPTPGSDIWTEVQANIPAPDITRINASRAAAEAELESLNGKFSSGDMEQADYMRNVQPVLAEIARLEQIPEAHRMAQAAQQEAAQNRWTDTVKRYEDANPELVSQEHVRGWDAELRAVTSTYPSLNFQQAIRLAHQRYEHTAALLGTGLKVNKAGENIALTPATPTQGQGSAATTPTKTEIQGQLQAKPEPPQTLRDVPGENAMATAPQIGDALEAVIDSGDNYKAEELFARMSPAQQEAFLRGAI